SSQQEKKVIVSFFGNKWSTELDSENIFVGLLSYLPKGIVDVQSGLLEIVKTNLSSIRTQLTVSGMTIGGAGPEPLQDLQDATHYAHLVHELNSNKTALRKAMDKVTTIAPQFFSSGIAVSDLALNDMIKKTLQDRIKMISQELSKIDLNKENISSQDLQKLGSY